MWMQFEIQRNQMANVCRHSPVEITMTYLRSEIICPRSGSLQIPSSGSAIIVKENQIKAAGNCKATLGIIATILEGVRERGPIYPNKSIKSAWHASQSSDIGIQPSAGLIRE